MPSLHKIAASLAEAKEAIPLSKTRLLVLDGQRICLAHTAAGLFVVEDTCPHLGESLSKGTTNYLDEVVCPWHSYRFSLRTGEECQDRCRPLRKFNLVETAEGLFVEV